MNINEIIALIPEDSEDEALLSIETVTTLPSTNSARVRCHLGREFRLHVQVRGHVITISAEGRPTKTCSQGSFLRKLRRTIYEIDAAMASGTYIQTAAKENLIFNDLPGPPEQMDIPIWDDKAGRWYDAEY